MQLARGSGRFGWIAIRRIASLFHAAAAGMVLLAAAPTAAFTLAFEAADFGLTPSFSNVRTFEFSIELAGPLATGVYDDPALVAVDYHVFGSLAATPSGFPAFNLVRSIAGSEFYAQGSSLRFEIAASADLNDGLQMSELVGGAAAFVFDGREVGTGRYHPALFELNQDGTGSIQNSNNTGGINPSSLELVDVQIGEEYVTALSFDPSTLTIAVPEASTGSMLGLTLALLIALRPRQDVLEQSRS
jgi:hypothetical protein